MRSRRCRASATRRCTNRTVIEPGQATVCCERPDASAPWAIVDAAMIDHSAPALRLTRSRDDRITVVNCALENFAGTFIAEKLIGATEGGHVAPLHSLAG